jgi:hypothetical protein
MKHLSLIFAQRMNESTVGFAKGMIVSDVMENMYTMTFKISRMAHVLLTYMF